MVGQADYLVPVQVKETLVFAVDHHVAPVEVAHVDHRVGVVDQREQLILADREIVMLRCDRGVRGMFAGHNLRCHRLPPSW